MPHRLCITTCPDAGSAHSIAQALVAERLAACVNVLPGVASVYRWQGAIESATEHLLLAKTNADRVPALQARLSALHPHELPELVVVDIEGGLPAYLDWITASTRPDTTTP